MKKTKKEIIEPYYKLKLRTSYISLALFLIASFFLITYTILSNNLLYIVLLIIFEVFFSLMSLLQIYNALTVKYPKNKEKDSRERNAINIITRIIFKIERLNNNITQFKNNIFNDEEEYKLQTLLNKFDQIKEKFYDFDLNKENVDIKLLNELLDTIMLIEIELKKLKFH